MGNIQTPMKMKNELKMEQLNNLNLNVFQQTSFTEFWPIQINKNYCELQIDLLIYKIHYCLKTNLNKFCKSNQKYIFF